MLGFLKVFGKGVLYTILLPFILLILVLYTVYCCFLFIYMLIKSLILWIMGNNLFSEAKEDVEAKKILLAQQNQEPKSQTNDQYKDALIATLASAVAAQAQSAQQTNQQIEEAPALDATPVSEIDHDEPYQLENNLDEQGDEE